MEQAGETTGFIQQNSPDGGFLQSEPWRKFQAAAGRKTFHLEKEDFSASIIGHSLPIVGEYFYCPRGPVFADRTHSSRVRNFFDDLIAAAKKEKTGWVRIDPASEHLLELIKENTAEKIVKAPHDMQPKEIFIIDITKSEQQLLEEMKPKTRYNINIAKKKGVVIAAGAQQYLDAFLKLTEEMAMRQGITAHGAQYYRKMVTTLPPAMLKIYVAEYEGQIVAANLMLFFGKFATYLHGASSSEHRNVMAPYLLQWQAIADAKNMGCTHYDFGGVKTQIAADNSWGGITKFKLGFSPLTAPVVFPGSYDIIINPRKYAVYGLLQKIKAAAYKMKKA
jgi:peptidoglycan pentaglycine glycine transferase (the first glycine)